MINFDFIQFVAKFSELFPDMSRITAIIAILIFALCSCVKETAPPPQIQIFSPSHLSDWGVGDSIFVQAQVNSSIDLEYIEINLLNTSQISVNPVQTLYPGGSSYAINTYYPVTNSALESGQHYFMLEASNGDATERAYVNIMLSGIPKRSMALVAYGYDAGSLPHIYKVDSLLQESLFKELSGDFKNGAVNPKDQLVYSIGEYSGSFYSIDAQSGTIINEIQATINPPFPYFTGISYTNSLVLLGLYEGYIKGYYGNGALKFSYLMSLFRPQKLKYDGTYILGSFEYYSGGAPAFGVIYEISGAVKDILFTAFETVDFFRASGDLVLIFGNNGSQSNVYTLNTNSMIITQIHAFDAGKIYSVTQTGSETYVLSHDNGLIYYNFGSNNSSSFYSGAKKGILCYDEVDERLYLSSGNEIYSYTWPGAAESGPLLMPDSIRDIHILYNR